MWRLKRNMTTGECWRRRSPNNCRCWLLLFAFFSGRLAVFSFSASQFLFCSHCLGSKCYTATTWPAGPLVRVLPSDYNACEATDQRTSQSTSPQLITPLLRQHNSKVAGGTVRPHTCGPRHKQLLPWSLILKLSRHFFRDTFQLISSLPLVRAADRPKGLPSFAYEGFEFHLAGKLASTTSQVDSFPIYKISSITTRSPLLLAWLTHWLLIPESLTLLLCPRNFFDLTSRGNELSLSIYPSVVSCGRNFNELWTFSGSWASSISKGKRDRRDV